MNPQTTIADFLRKAENRGLLDDVLEQKTPITEQQILDIALGRMNASRPDDRRWTINPSCPDYVTLMPPR